MVSLAGIYYPEGYIQNIMRYLQFYELMRSFTVFSLADIRAVDPGFHRRRLAEWQQKGYLRKIIKGYYMFSEIPLCEEILFEVANRIYIFPEDNLHLCS